MHRLKFIIPLLLFSCDLSTDNQATINSLELLLDSLTNNTIERDAGFEIADSLLNYDPTNFRALSIVGTKYFNDREPSKAIPYFKKALLHADTTEMDYINSNSLCLGWSYEQINEMDSAKKYYELTLNRIDNSWNVNIGKPHFVTILYGRDEGLKSLKNYNFGKPYFKEQLKNDIELYSGGGLSEFTPWFFGSQSFTDFQITIPNELYDNGILNSSPKVLLMFAKQGININITEVNTINKTYKFYTNEKYVDLLVELDTLGLKRL